MTAAVMLSSFVACARIDSRQPSVAIPEIQAKWSVASDLSAAFVSITNSGPRSIKVDPATAFLSPDPRIGPIWPVYEAGLIQPVIVPVDSADQPIPMGFTLNRPQAFPVIIEPGEKRTIKIAVEGDTTGPDGRRVSAAAVRCSLWRDGKELTRETVARSVTWRRW